MKLFKKITFKKRQSNYKLLKEQIKSLEDRIFNKKKETDFLTDSTWNMYWGSYEPETLEEEIFILQDKVDALCKTLKLDLKKTDKKEPEWVAKPVKAKKTKK